MSRADELQMLVFAYESLKPEVAAIFGEDRCADLMERWNAATMRDRRQALGHYHLALQKSKQSQKQ